MKNLILIYAGIITMSILPASAQKLSSDKPITISDISAEKVWQIAEMAMNDNKIPVGKLDLEKGLLMSDWLEWSAIAIQNHGRLFLKYDSPNLVLNMADREYKSDKGWVEAIGSLSKKNYATYMEAIADRINEINKDEALTKQAVKTSKLIPAFNPVNTVGELVLTLKKTSYKEMRPLLEFTVQNSASYELTVDMPLIELYTSIDGKLATRASSEWSRPDEKMRRQAIIQPGETLIYKVIYDYDWKLSAIPRLDMRIICKGAKGEKTHNFKMYQIPLTYYVFNPEQQ